MKRTLKTTKRTIETSGDVELLELVRDGSREVYAVSYPAKLGGFRETQQFMVRDEAVREFHRYADYFRKAKGE